MNHSDNYNNIIIVTAYSSKEISASAIWEEGVDE